ncbi:MAG TPA: peptide chain release factor N(5)-glutamine methyltransferase [Gemmatimonadales bacterium]
MVEAPATIATLIAQGTAAFRASGIDEPRRDALRLWSDLALPTAHLLRTDASVAAADADRYLAAVAARAAGAPLAYVTGWTGFRHLTIRCDRRALIPRPETEGLVERALSRVSTGIAVDVGTGTGAIALSLAMEGRFDEVWGIDLSGDALSLAAENGTSTGISVRWVHGDLLDPIARGRVDLIVSNPPYLTANEYDTLPSSVRDYEPELALRSGTDGLDATRRLLQRAQEALKPGGWIAMEVDCRRADAAAASASDGGWRDIVIEDDLFGRARYLLARRGTE